MIQRKSAVELLRSPRRIFQVVVGESAIEDSPRIILITRQAVKELPILPYVQISIEREVLGDVGVQLECQFSLCQRLIKRPAIPISFAQIPMRKRISWIVAEGLLK